MAWNLSTTLKNKLLSEPGRALIAYQAGDFDFSSVTKLISGDAAQFIVQGFDSYLYDTISVIGSTSNDGDYRIEAVAAGAITCTEPYGYTFTTEDVAETITLVVSRGGSFSSIMRNSYLDLYSGSRPASADLIEAGTKLVRISHEGTTFTPAAAAGGINFDDAASGALGLADKVATATTQVLAGEGLVTGSALFGRLYENSDTGGASTTKARMDGRVAISNSEINMSAGTTITDGVDADVTSLSFSI